MDEGFKYQLIKSVDPTKVKVPLNEKFNKLTLSSNKKKKDDLRENQKEQLIEKRESASRNLLKELSNAEIPNVDPKDRVYINPILRSDSSSKDSKDNETDINVSDDQILSEQKSFEHQNYNEILDQTEQMDRLQITEDFSSNCSSEDISENCDKSRKKYVEKNETEQNLAVKQISTTSLTSQLQFNANNASISISSSDSEEDSIISISDSDSNDTKSMTFDFDLMTSDIPKSGQTENGLLPCTFSNDKADRVEAFLHDVSQECERNKWIQQQDTVDNITDLYQSFESIKLHDGKNLVDADTESVTTGILTENNNSNTLKSSKNLVDADTESVTIGIITENINSNTLKSNSVEKLGQAHRLKFGDLRRSVSLTNITTQSKMLANDDTVINTDVSSESISMKEVSIGSHDNTVNSRENSLPPEESIIISETSNEFEDSSKSENFETPVLKNNIQNDSEDSDLEISQIKLGIGSINISAKINIKIHIPEEETSDDNSEESMEECNSDEFKTKSNEQPLSLPQENSALNECVQQKQYKNKNTTIVETRSPEDKFLTHAEKLLNQLYGKSWQTPDVIHKLKQTKTTESKSSLNNDANSVNKVDQISSSKETEDRGFKHQEIKIVEESILDDFSIFKRNIVKTNLDSTRLVTPRQQNIPKNATSEPRRNNRIDTVRRNIKVPQTEKKAPVMTKKGRVIKERWRQLVDEESESEYDNASDDEDVDYSLDKENSNDTDTTDDENEFVNKKHIHSKRMNRKGKENNKTAQSSKDKIIYLDLTQHEIIVHENPPDSPPANHDDVFKERLQNILRTCASVDKPKIEGTPSTKTKRKLFTVEDEDVIVPPPESPKTESKSDESCISFNDPTMIKYFNKKLEAVKNGTPLFFATPPRNVKKCTPKSNATPKSLLYNENKIPKSSKKNYEQEKICTSDIKYGFLKSLDVCVSKKFCDPDALYYRDNYRIRKEELATKLYKLYNEKLFSNELNVPIVWNKKLLNTAGRCLNKKKFNTRSSVVELSEKVLTSADRLRCTLIHELCHAATWVFNGEGGHGATWKEWARKANSVFPEIPKIGVCHQYEIEYKYTYKCTLCDAKSHAHSKSKKVENIRCSYCHGAIEIFLNKKDKFGNIVPTPVKTPTGFAKFVQENYKQYKQPQLKHADIMKLLSNEFAALKVTGKAN
ncbi:putative uncharacterized protein DDB_G0282133 [Teleopsis dalmanni]|uniref:putative uncharacterized protein DDB_G0282133 n=1 Tax=Teleopsis dalmanni TaxID=139649 RepID=UPI0018CD0806|nr:putative uncharacterized protein DDB_G0282133 [Teleopsis dalmanni]